MAASLRDPSVVEPVEASFANSAKGVKWRLKQRRWVLWQRLCKEMEEVKLRPVSWGYFSLLTGTKQYELLTADNCCCGICIELGFDNCDTARLRIAPGMKRYVATTDKERPTEKD